MSDGVRAIVAELRRRLERLYGERLERMILFGSRARGDAEPDSDIDLRVVLRGEVDPFREIERTSELVAEMSLRHDVAISPAFFSTERFAGPAGPFLMNVRRDGIAVWWENRTPYSTRRGAASASHANSSRTVRRSSSAPPSRSSIVSPSRGCRQPLPVNRP